MKYNYFEPGKLFYLNGLGFGTTSIAIKNNVISVKCANPLAGLALKAQIERQLAGVKPSIESLKNVIESISDHEMKTRLSKGTIQDIKRAMASR